MGFFRSGAEKIGSHLKKFGSATWDVTKKVGSGIAKAARAVDDLDDKYFGGMGKHTLLSGAQSLAEAAVKKVNSSISDDSIKKHSEPAFGAAIGYLANRRLRKGYNTPVPSTGGLKNSIAAKFDNATSSSSWNPYSNEAHTNISHW